jgi:hypothetical protein
MDDASSMRLPESTALDGHQLNRRAIGFFFPFGGDRGPNRSGDCPHC